MKVKQMLQCVRIVFISSISFSVYMHASPDTFNMDSIDLELFDASEKYEIEQPVWHEKITSYLVTLLIGTRSKAVGFINAITSSIK